MSDPLAFFITFTTYGTWLHGDERGSVDREHNVVGEPYLPPDQKRRKYEQNLSGLYLMDEPRREIALEAIRTKCRRKKWTLHACHVRSNHVHVLLSSPEQVERVMNGLKGTITVAMNKAYPEENHRKRWSRHGSTRYVWNEEAFEKIRAYILQEQGDTMSVYPVMNDK